LVPSIGLPVRAVVDPAPWLELLELSDPRDRHVRPEDVQVFQRIDPGQRGDGRVRDSRVVQLPRMTTRRRIGAKELLAVARFERLCFS
jgi:hypothetical protein